MVSLKNLLKTRKALVVDKAPASPSPTPTLKQRKAVTEMAPKEIEASYGGNTNVLEQGQPMLVENI